MTQQVRMSGNSVSPPPIAALKRTNDPWHKAVALKDAA
jgi:DNA (cytosine-5)-methyltransferase 1